jgi:hypothetical protein
MNAVDAPAHEGQTRTKKKSDKPWQVGRPRRSGEPDGVCESCPYEYFWLL